MAGHDRVRRRPACFDGLSHDLKGPLRPDQTGLQALMITPTVETDDMIEMVLPKV